MIISYGKKWEQGQILTPLSFLIFISKPVGKIILFLINIPLMQGQWEIPPFFAVNVVSITPLYQKVRGISFYLFNLSNFQTDSFSGLEPSPCFLLNPPSCFLSISQMFFAFEWRAVVLIRFQQRTLEA